MVKPIEFSSPGRRALPTWSELRPFLDEPDKMHSMGGPVGALPSDVLSLKNHRSRAEIC